MSEIGIIAILGTLLASALVMLFFSCIGLRRQNRQLDSAHRCMTEAKALIHAGHCLLAVAELQAGIDGICSIVRDEAGRVVDC